MEPRFTPGNLVLEPTVFTMTSPCSSFSLCKRADSIGNALVEDKWQHLLRKCRELSSCCQGLQGGWRPCFVGARRNFWICFRSGTTRNQAGFPTKGKILSGRSKYNTKRFFQRIEATQCWHSMLLIAHFLTFFLFKGKRNVLFSRITLGEKARRRYWLPNCLLKWVSG